MRIYFIMIFFLSSSVATAYQSDSSRVRHPVSSQILTDINRITKTKVSSLSEQIVLIKDLSAQQIRSLISDMNGFGGCPCPNCGEDTLKFNINELYKIKCTNCGAVYPNRKFPSDRSIQFINPHGKKIIYRYHSNGGGRYFIPGKIRRERHLTLSKAALASAMLYHHTKKEKYANLALIIIDRFADVYPSWCVHYDHVKWLKGVAEKRPWPYFGGKWNYWHYLDMPIDLIYAYDLIYDSKALYEYDANFGNNARQNIENFFRSAYKFIMECNEDHGMVVGNMTPYTCRHLIACGRVIDEPDMIHTAVNWMQRLCANNFYFDGMWSEGALGYHSQTVSNLLRAEKALDGYSDPVGYVDTKYGIVINGKTPYVDYNCAEELIDFPEKVLYPDGSYSRIHDTDWNRKKAPPDDLNIELNGFGHFAIGRGEGDDVIQAHLHFCPLLKYSHMHSDHLNIIIFGAGRELVSDIGYARGKHRYFATSQIGHNVVAVDWTQPPIPLRTKMDYISKPIDPMNNSKSGLLAYDPGVTSDKWIQLIEAESLNAFGINLPMYRRALMLIGANRKRSYLMDVFRIEGGTQHDWLLHGSSDEDMATSTDTMLKPMKGTLASGKNEFGQTVRVAPSFSYGIDNLKLAPVDDGLRFIWRGKKSGASLISWILPITGGKAIFGEAPSCRRTGPTKRDMGKYKMPFIDLRNAGNNYHQNTYIAIYDATKVGQKPIVDEVKNIPLNIPDPLAKALFIRCGNRTDTIYISMDDSARKVDSNTFSGRFAIISRLNGKTDYVYGWGFSKIEFDEGQLTATPTTSFRVTGTLRKADDEQHNGIIIKGSFPEVNLDQTWVRVIHGDGTAHGYMIIGTRKYSRNQTLLVTYGDPGFRVVAEGIKMTHFPHWKIKGINFLEIFNSTFLKMAGNRVVELRTTLPQSINVKLNRPK